jgi:hypothetical protein
MVDDDVRILDPTEGVSRMTFLSARLFARRFPQALGPGLLLQSVTRWWLAAVAAVQSQPAFQFGYAGVRSLLKLTAAASHKVPILAVNGVPTAPRFNDKLSRGFTVRSVAAKLVPGPG